MRKKNKILSALLAVLFLLSAMSISAFAADGSGGSTTLTTTIPCTVTLQVGDHGKVTVNSTDYSGDASFTAAVGTALTYTFTPNTLYKVDKVIYNGTDVTGELSGSTYTAPALAGNATLSVSFKFIGGGGTDTYTVTFNANGHGTAPASQTVLSGNKAAEPTAPTASGWTFGGWYKDSACTETQKYDFNTPVTANLTLYAKWTEDTPVTPPAPETCTVTFDAGGGTGSMTPVTVEKGAEYTLPANGFTAPSGKVFDKWDKGTVGEKITVNEDITVIAQWKDEEVTPPVPETCTVTFDAGGGTGSMTPVSVEKGAEYTLPANGFTAPSGKVFDKWDKGTVGTKVTVNTDVTVTAQWKNKETEPVDPGYDFKFTFTKTWQGDHEDSIDWVLYNPDGTVAHKKFNKKIVSENEWRYEAWFASGADYYIIETVPEGYKVRYENVGKYADITDRCCNGGTIINYKLPKTGDTANLRLWLGYVLLGVSAVCGALVFSRRKKENR